MTEPYKVHEIFATLQGEATWTGTPAVFIRLMGCDVGCPWCDTKMTWTADPENQLAELPRGPRGTDKGWATLCARDIAQRAREEGGSGIRHAVLTGGEPLAHDLGPLVNELHARDFSRVQIETSGTYPVKPFPTAANVWLTVSPKCNMPGGRGLVRATLLAADEIKWPVGKPSDLEHLQETMGPARMPIWLQPLSRSEKATKLAMAACLQYGYRLSIQTHLYLGLP
ncbi:MAG: coenzyme biosynthesis protein [Arthrobacter sp.]|jgi:7-carboxy-7-deazaguanine synthase|nr:coenzyme biosynthesis protein [Arthrobacter sp.]